METVLKAIADWIKGILTAGIMSNLSGLFDDVNTQVVNIAQQVGTKPSSFEPRVFAMIEERCLHCFCTWRIGNVSHRQLCGAANSVGKSGYEH